MPNDRTSSADSQPSPLRVIDGGRRPNPTPPTIAVVRSPELRELLLRLHRANGHGWGPLDAHEHAAALRINFVTFRDRLRRLVREGLIQSDVGVRVRVVTFEELLEKRKGDRP